MKVYNREVPVEGRIQNEDDHESMSSFFEDIPRG